jgi:hypothetical protein
MDPDYRRVTAEIRGQLPLVIDIAGRVNVELANRFKAVRWSPGFLYEAQLDACA